MKPSKLRLICRCAQWIPEATVSSLPRRMRGIYALLNRSSKGKYDVVYIGMANGKLGIRGRLTAHQRSKDKKGHWTHFSFFEVWPNITESEIQELEGLFREIYRKDTNANSLAVQKRYGRLRKVRFSLAKIKGDKLEELKINNRP